MNQGRTSCCFNFNQVFGRILSVPLIAAALPAIFLFSFISFIQFRTFPFYCQLRGLNLSSRIFRIYKIRTLRLSAGGIQCAGIFYKNELSGFLSPFCSWLRKTGLDELPQLLNVLKGEMCLVGPRPLSLHDLHIMKANYPGSYSAREKLKVKPGITGLWQTYRKRSGGISELIEMDTYYDRNICIKLDIQIILRTLLISCYAGNTDSIPTKKYYSSMNRKGLYPIVRAGDCH